MPAAPTVRTATQLLDRGLSAVDALTRATDRASLDPDVVAATPLAGRELLLPGRTSPARSAGTSRPGMLDAIVAAQDPLGLATAMIAAKHAELGGPGGLLGASTTAVTGCPDGVGYYRHFAGGSVYWHPMTGAHEVHGDLRAHWSGLGWERSFLGYPTSDELVGRDPAAAGRVSHFQGGSLYWCPAMPPRLPSPRRRPSAPARSAGRSGGPDAVGRLDPSLLLHVGVLPPSDDLRGRPVFEVHGAIRSRYLALGRRGLLPRLPDHRRDRHARRRRPLQPLPGRVGLLDPVDQRPRGARAGPRAVGGRRVGARPSSATR